MNAKVYLFVFHVHIVYTCCNCFLVVLSTTSGSNFLKFGRFHALKLHLGCEAGTVADGYGLI